MRIVDFTQMGDGRIGKACGHGRQSGATEHRGRPRGAHAGGGQSAQRRGRRHVQRRPAGGEPVEQRLGQACAGGVVKRVFLRGGQMRAEPGLGKGCHIIILFNEIKFII